jgi:hypothetical protein
MLTMIYMTRIQNMSFFLLIVNNPSVHHPIWPLSGTPSRTLSGPCRASRLAPSAIPSGPPSGPRQAPRQVQIYIYIFILFYLNPKFISTSYFKIQYMYKYPAQMSFHKSGLYVLHCLPHLGNHGCVLVHTIYNQTHEEVGG